MLDRVKTEDVYKIPGISNDDFDSTNQEHFGLKSFREMENARQEKEKEFRTLDWEKPPKDLQEAILRKQAQQWYDEYNKTNPSVDETSPLGYRRDPLDYDPHANSDWNRQVSDAPQFMNPVIPLEGQSERPIPIEQLREALKRKQQWMKENVPPLRKIKKKEEEVY